MDRLKQLRAAGVSIWLDTLSRDLLETGAFAELVRSSSVTGATTNPTIFATAITASTRYDAQLAQAVEAGTGRRISAARPTSSRASSKNSACVLAVDRLASVASFFVSRVDAKADVLLPAGSPLRGRVAVANAHRAYGSYLARFSGPRWEALERRGATPQRPLWTSTGTKDPSYSDVLYVAELLAPGVINTMPEKTPRAWADHGDVGRALQSDVTEAERLLAAAADSGVDLRAIAHELEREGVKAFGESYAELLACLDSKLTDLAPARA